MSVVNREAHSPSRRAYGIDLGTTHTLAAGVVSGVPECVPLEEGRMLLPSVVAPGATGADPSVGTAAILAPGALHSMKRRIGRDPRAIDAATELLKAVRARLGAPGPVVLTVPAYFDEIQRQATREAARRADLEVLRLLNEPTAAALAYGLDRKVAGKFLVYDLGGGTFDASVLLLDDGVFQVLSTNGDTELGGDDFDRALAARFGGGPLEARRAREALTERESIAEPWPITREEFEGLPEIEALVDRTLRCCARALSDAGLQAKDLHGIVMVGGMTRTPLIRRAVEQRFGVPLHVGLDPDRVVALGAAIQAELLVAGSDGSVLLLDVNPLSLGVEMMGGVVERLIPRNTPIPTTATMLFTTFQDRQTGLDLHVVQGERELAADCRSLARFKLSGLPPAPAGAVQVELTFALDSDGLLRVTAREKGGGRGQGIELDATRGLDAAAIDEALFDAIDHAEEDLTARALREARTKARQLVAATRQHLADHADLLDEYEATELPEFARMLEESCEGDDAGKIQVLSEAFAMISGAFIERVVNHEVGRRVKGRGVSEFDVE